MMIVSVGQRRSSARPQSSGTMGLLQLTNVRKRLPCTSNEQRGCPVAIDPMRGPETLTIVVALFHGQDAMRKDCCVT
jgi:hypothetical protein